MKIGPNVRNRVLYLSAMIVCSQLLLGCKTLHITAQTDMYRIDFAEELTYQNKGDIPESALQVSKIGTEKEYRLAFIEYDDQGQLHDPDQSAAVLDHYGEIAEQDDVLIVTFMHGWHHSSKPQDENIRSFRDLLIRTSTYESQLSDHEGRTPRKILGVYLGWRGESLKVPGLRYFTFWRGKTTAEEVGSQGITETLLRLENIAELDRDGNEKDENRNRMVTMGHSFGAAALYSALRGVLAERFLETRPHGSASEAGGFGDLVVLLNPAFEAMQHGSLWDLSQENGSSYPDSQTPKLVIMTAANDKGTRWAFPFGRFFSTINENHRVLDRTWYTSEGEVPIQIKEYRADKTAIGHQRLYMTHSLKQDDSSNKNFSIKDISVPKGAWTNNSLTRKFQGTILTSLDRTHHLNPYLNIFVSKDIIGGHNDIWNNEIALFVAELIAISTSDQHK